MGEGPYGSLEREEKSDPARGDAGASPPAAEPVLAASRRARRRGDRRHGYPHAHRRRRRQGRAGGDPVLRHRWPDLHRRRARLCRDGDDDPRLGQRLYLHLCRARRIARLDRRLEPDPRIQPGGQRGRGRLVGLHDRLPGGHAIRDSRALLAAGPELGGIAQPAGHLHHRRRRRPADLRDSGERDGERAPGRR